MSEPLGYVVVEWNQASHRPDLDHGVLHDDLDWAHEVARMQREKTRKTGRGERYTVHAVVAEPIESGEDGDGR